MKNKKVIWPETLVNHLELQKSIFFQGAQVLPQRIDLVLLQLGFLRDDLAKTLDNLALRPLGSLTVAEKQSAILTMKQLSELVDSLFKNLSRLEIKLISLDSEVYCSIRLNTVKQICLWLNLLPYRASAGLRRKWLKNQDRYQKND